MRAYSNPSDQVERIRSLLELPRAAGRERRQRPAKQAQTRLDPDQVAQLVAAYQAGARVKQLARRQGVILRPRGIHPDDLAEVICLIGGGAAFG